MNLTLKRGVFAGAANLITGLGLGWLIGIILPAIAEEYQNTAIFRPWSDPRMMVYFAYPFILGLAYAYIWSMVERQFKGNDRIERAGQFAKLYFIIATVPGMFITYTSFQVSLMMVLL